MSIESLAGALPPRPPPGPSGPDPTGGWLGGRLRVASFDSARYAQDERAQDGDPWGAESEGAMLSSRIEQAIFALLSRRKPGATICPSEVARLLAAAEGEDAWRALMEPVRETARGLVRAGRLLVTQGGVPVDPASAKGAIRLRLP